MMEKPKIIAVFLRIVYWILRPIYFLLSLRPNAKLPQIKSPYLYMSATRIAKGIRNSEIKSRAVVDVFIEQIKAVNPIINAVVQDRFKEAQEDADKVDEFIAVNKQNLEIIKKEKPLLGVPFTVKESCSVKGMPLSIGCLSLEGKLADDDGEAVNQLRTAGAIPLAVTNTPELCYSCETNNSITGLTRNPYNIHRTVGGSSGGEGAIIASGASIFGIGSDLGGSIRLPAMFNGIFGHKPTPGFVSYKGHFPAMSEANLQKFFLIGPMARYSEDLPLLLKVLSGDKAHTLNLDEKVDINKLNIFYIEEATSAWYDVPVDKEIKDHMKEAVHFMNEVYGCHVEKGPFEELSDFAAISSAIILGTEGLPNLLQYAVKKNGKNNEYFEIVKAIFGFSEFTTFSAVINASLHKKLYTDEQYEKYYQLNEKLKIKFQNVLKDDGVLFYPTSPTPATQHTELLTLFPGVTYTMIVNALELPSTHVPLGLNTSGLPIGFQVIAGPKQDRLCLAVAKALEEKFSGWIPPV